MVLNALSFFTNPMCLTGSAHYLFLQGSWDCFTQIQPAMSCHSSDAWKAAHIYGHTQRSSRPRKTSVLLCRDEEHFIRNVPGRKHSNVRAGGVQTLLHSTPKESAPYLDGKASSVPSHSSVSSLPFKVAPRIMCHWYLSSRQADSA